MKGITFDTYLRELTGPVTYPNGPRGWSRPDQIRIEESEATDLFQNKSPTWNITHRPDRTYKRHVHLSGPYKSLQDAKNAVRIILMMKP